MRATDLRIPGPTPLPPAVLRAMQREMIPHRGPVFKALFQALLRQVQWIHGTDGDVVILPGTGSAGWEAAIVNTLSPGDDVLAIVTGDFGARFAAVGDALGLSVTRIEVEWGQAATVDVVRDALEANPRAKAVFFTYNETSTGITNPLPDIGPLVRQHGALLFVDAVSAAAGLPIEMDRWQVDLVLSGSQKAWMCPPGLVIVALGRRVWDAYERAVYPRFFWDFKQAVRHGMAGDTPTTAPLTMIYALKAACDMIEAEGLSNVYARHARVGQLVRSGLCDLGYDLFGDPRFASNTVTAVCPPAGLAVSAILEALRRDDGIEVAAGQGPLTDQIIRIGHMGWIHEPEIRRLLEAMKRVTERLSYRNP